MNIKSDKWKNLFDDYLKCLVMHGNLSCYQEKDLPKLLVIPISHHYVVAEKYHNYGHFYRRKLVLQIMRTCYWPGISDTTKAVCETCERCQKRKTPKHATN